MPMELVQRLWRLHYPVDEIDGTTCDEPLPLKLSLGTHTQPMGTERRMYEEAVGPGQAQCLSANPKPNGASPAQIIYGK
jgi:hypothetical protein